MYVAICACCMACLLVVSVTAVYVCCSARLWWVLFVACCLGWQLLGLTYCQSYWWCACLVIDLPAT